MIVEDAPGDTVHEVPDHPHHGPIQLHHGDHGGVPGEELGQQRPVTTPQYQDVRSSEVHVRHQRLGVNVVRLRQLSLAIQKQHSEDEAFNNFRDDVLDNSPSKVDGIKNLYSLIWTSFIMDYTFYRTLNNSVV